MAGRLENGHTGKPLRKVNTEPYLVTRKPTPRPKSQRSDSRGCIRPLSTKVRSTQRGPGEPNVQGQCMGGQSTQSLDCHPQAGLATAVPLPAP